MKKMSTRIILVVLLCSVGLGTVIGTTSILRSRSAIEQEANSSLINEVELNAKVFNEDLIRYETTVSNIAQLLEGSIDTNRLKEPGYLKDYSESILRPVVTGINRNTSNSSGIYIAFDPQFTGSTEGIWQAMDADGNEMQADLAEVSGKDENDPDVGWYFSALNRGEASWGDFYDNDASVTVMSYSTPIVVNNKTLGVIGMDLSADKLIEHVENIQVYDSGYASILSADFDYLIHPSLDSSSNLRTLQDGTYEYMVDEIESKNSGLIDTTHSGDKATMAFARLQDGKIITLTAIRTEMLSSMFTTVYIILTTLFVGILVIAGISLFMGRQIANPIVLVTGLLDRTANLNLRELD